MIKQTVIKTALFLVLILVIYYFLILKPAQAKKKILIQNSQVYSQIKSDLLQNRIAYTGLVGLDPNSPTFDYQKDYLITAVSKTNQDARQKLEQNQSLNPEIINKTLEFYNNQSQILKEIFETDSLEDGIKIIKSDRSIEALTKQSNLILTYESLARF